MQSNRESSGYGWIQVHELLETMDTAATLIFLIIDTTHVMMSALLAINGILVIKLLGYFVSLHMYER